MNDILILRHGQTEWNLARRFQGAMDSALTALGLRQARAQGAILAAHVRDAGAYHVLTSPQPRAARTAGLALAAIGRQALPDARLREISVGAWEGLTRAEIVLGPEFDDDVGIDWMDQAPQGEGHASVATRVAQLLADLPGPAILVTHGVTSCHLRGQLLGLDWDKTAELRTEQGVVYRIRGGREEVLRDDESPLATAPSRR